MKLKVWWIRYRNVLLMSFYSLAAMMTIYIGVGFLPTPMTTHSETMSMQIPNIVGNWEKITRSECSQRYPDSIQFQEGQLYFGQKDPPGTFTLWDVGTYEIVDPQHMNISTANDAILMYEFSASNDVLTFVDPDACTFSFRKVIR